MKARIATCLPLLQGRGGEVITRREGIHGVVHDSKPILSLCMPIEKPEGQNGTEEQHYVSQHTILDLNTELH